jgi:hypothetical protein
VLLAYAEVADEWGNTRATDVTESDRNDAEVTARESGS